MFKVNDIDEIPFSAQEYSRFKYGSKKYARKFGENLAKSYLQSDKFAEYESFHSNKTIVILSSPYCFVPTATFAMKDYFMSVLNTSLFDKGYRPAQECKIFREYSYNSDYGNMGRNERKKCISSDTFQINWPFLKDKYCIFMDDIRVTGSHEERIDELLYRHDMHPPYTAGVMHLYLSEIDSEDIDPKIESYLNLAYVKDLESISNIIQEDEFEFNTRNIKFILGRPFEEFKWFLRFQKVRFVNTLYHYAIGNSYNLLEEFKQNFNHLNSIVTWYK